jgi:hypothetical protein
VKELDVLTTNISQLELEQDNHKGLLLLLRLVKLAQQVKQLLLLLMI